MHSATSTELRRRLDDRIEAWRIVVERIAETHSSILAFGRRNDDPVVLKVVRTSGDEWRSGEIVRAFEGRGVVRVSNYASLCIHSCGRSVTHFSTVHGRCWRSARRIFAGLCVAAFSQRLRNGYEFPKAMKGGTPVSAFWVAIATFGVSAYPVAERMKVHAIR